MLILQRRIVAFCSAKVAPWSTLASKTPFCAVVLISRLQVFVTAMMLALFLGGCRDRTADFTPSPELAKAALEQAMHAWQAGKPAGEISGAKPAIHVTDNHQQRQRGLEKYRILGETVARSGRTYVVELALKSPEEKVKTEYIVVGIDPLWVFRREDYELLMHWDHRMPDLPQDTEVR